MIVRDPYSVAYFSDIFVYYHIKQVFEYTDMRYTQNTGVNGVASLTAINQF